MSSIDERVVSMKFNNSQFESGIKQTQASLEGLKKGLNLDASAKSLEGLDAAGKKFSLQGMADGVQSVASKFNALSVIGITALANITSKAVNAGLNFAKSFTVKPILDGLKEYETQLNSVQTILANTSAKGSTLEDVNGALAELNTYADKTIYNFSEMTRNIGTFTAAGVDLETSTTAIKGIANLAALSGSNSQQASTAMYQLSQALSSGTVKLQDWNSVVNAGMGGQVFQDALTETARANGVAVDSLIEKNGSFRESLQEGWLSADIMTQTLEKMTMATEGATEAEIEANREKLRSQGYNEEQIASIFKMADTATNAATKVKTFTQLMETLEEAVGSGWSKTWEILLGDFEEAKVLFTGISDVLGKMIGDSADSRNNLLEGWKELGGRQKIVDALWLAFHNLMTILAPIKEAFTDIFPPATAEQLMKLTEGFYNLMDIVWEDDVLANIKSIFKGLFAVLDVGIFIVMKIAKVIGTLFKVAFSGSGVILDTAGNVGDLLVKFRDMVKSGEGVTTFFNTIQRTLIYVIVKIKQFVAAIFSLASGFKDLDFSSFSSALEGMGKRLDPLKNLGETIAKIWGRVTGVLSGLISFFAPLASTIGKLFGGIGRTIADSVQDMDFNAILDLVNTGLLAGIALLIRKFLKGGVPDVGGGLVDSIKDVFGGLTDTMGAMQTQLKAGTLVKIAGAIALLTASVLVLSMIDSGALTKALLAITVMFGQLFVSMAIFEKATMGAGFAKMPLVAASMILLGGAILVLVAAVSLLARLSWEDLAKGLLGVTVLLKGLTTAVQSMAANPAKLISTGVGLMALAVAVKILASAVQDFAGMGWADMAKGLVGVGTVLGALVLFTKLAQVNKGAVGQSVGILLLGAALKVMASAVADFAAINSSSLIKGLGAVGVVLAEVALFTNLTGNAKGVIRTAASMVILGAALKIFASVMNDFAGMSWESIGKGMAGIAGALLIIAGAMHLMPKNMILTATSLVIVGAALKIMTEALQNMGTMSWEEIGKSMVVLAGSLLILAGAMYLMTAALPGALSLIIVAGALAILTPALIAMSQLSWEEIAKGLVMLAGVFLVIGLAGLALTPVIPTLLGLGVAILLLGAGAALAGVGILAMAMGITALSVAAAAGTAGIVTLVAGVLGLIPMIFEALGEGIIAFAKVIEAGVPAIISAFVAMVVALLEAIIEMAPTIGEAFVVLVSTLLDVIIELSPKIVDALVALLTGLMDVVIRMIPVIATIFVTLVGSILDSIRTLIPKGVAIFTSFVSAVLTSIKILIPQGVAIFVTFVAALLNALRTLQPQIVATFTAMVVSLLNAIRRIGPEIVDTFIAIIRSILRGVTTISGEIVDTFVKMVHLLVDTLVAGIPYLVNSGMRLVLGVLNGINRNIRQIVTVGFAILSNLLRGISDGIPGLIQAAADVVITFVESLSAAIRNNQARMNAAGAELGWAIADGMTGGLASKVGEVVQGAKNLAANAIEGAKNLLGINSPSKVFFGFGQNTGEGYINGLSTMNRGVAAASEKMGTVAIDEIKTSISRIADFMSQDMDMNPTITPVLDLDELRREAGNINSMLNSQPFSLEAGYASAAAIARANRDQQDDSANQNGSDLSETPSVTFIQNNNSPKALSNPDLYRKTKSQLALKLNPKGVPV